MEGVIGFFTAFWANLVGLFGGQVWLLLVLTILFVTLVVDFVVRRVLKKTHHHLEIKEKYFLDAFVDGARSPMSFFIWVNALALMITTVMYQFQLWLDWVSWVQAAKSSVLILALGWFVIRVMNRMEDCLKAQARKDERFDEVTVEALVKIIKLTAFVITGLIVLSAFNVNLTGLLAFGGMGGIAVGFAAKDLLGNVFGGLMLYMDKPFTVGDWIRSPDQELEGTVEKIGWRMTVVRTFDKRPLYIPNGTFSNISIENPSRMTNRRIKEVIGVRYDDLSKVKVIADDIREMLRQHPDIDQNQTLIVNFLEFADSSLNFLVYTFTKTTDWVTFHHIKEDVLLQIAEVVASHNAEMAFPTRTLYVEDKVLVEGLKT